MKDCPSELERDAAHYRAAFEFIKKLKNAAWLSPQARHTLRGQALRGDLEGAERGFKRLQEARR